jgi:hypothetical protein
MVSEAMHSGSTGMEPFEAVSSTEFSGSYKVKFIREFEAVKEH